MKSISHKGTQPSTLTAQLYFSFLALSPTDFKFLFNRPAMADLNRVSDEKAS